MSTRNSASASPLTYAYLRSDGTAYIVWGSAIAGFGAYAYQLMGGRVLGAEAFAPVSMLLTIHFLTFIVIMMPIEQLVVRRLTIDPTRVHLPRNARWLGVATIVVATVVAFVGVEPFLNGDRRFVVFTGLAVAAHFVFAVARGRLAAQRRFRGYGIASGAASVLRLGVAVAVTLAHPSASGFALALIVGPLVVLLWRPFSSQGELRDRTAARRPDDVPNLLGGLVFAAAASQALLLAGPIMVGMLGGSVTEVSIAFACFTLGRAPLVFGYNLLARVLPPFTRMAAEGRAGELTAWARGIAIAGVALATIAGALGWSLGPWFVEAAFGPGFVATRATTTLVLAGVVLAAGGLFVGQILVASGDTRRLALAWFAGVVLAVAAILVTPDVPVIVRVTSAFLVGEAAALTALVVGAVRSTGERRSRRPGTGYEVTKRTLDIAVSLTLLILMTPVLLVIGIAVWVDTPGPIFFRQDRVGRHGKVFQLYKVRTMEADADERVFAAHLAKQEEAMRKGVAATVGIEGDQRTTRVGRMLRTWSLDEIPNLLNVVRGSLSLVGPRPLVPEEAALVGLDHARFTVKPGITGLAQVNGRTTLSMEERSRYDEAYVRRRSTTIDLEILLKTAHVVKVGGNGSSRWRHARRW